MQRSFYSILMSLVIYYWERRGGKNWTVLLEANHTNFKLLRDSFSHLHSPNFSLILSIKGMIMNSSEAYLCILSTKRNRTSPRTWKRPGWQGPRAGTPATMNVTAWPPASRSPRRFPPTLEGRWDVSYHHRRVHDKDEISDGCISQIVSSWKQTRKI